MVLLLPLVDFSMDGVGQHQTTALAEEDQHLLPISLLSVVVAPVEAATEVMKSVLMEHAVQG